MVKFHNHMDRRGRARTTKPSKIKQSRSARAHMRPDNLWSSQRQRSLAECVAYIFVWSSCGARVVMLALSACGTSRHKYNNLSGMCVLRCEHLRHISSHAIMGYDVWYAQVWFVWNCVRDRDICLLVNILQCYRAEREAWGDTIYLYVPLVYVHNRDFRRHSLIACDMRVYHRQMHVCIQVSRVEWLGRISHIHTCTRTCTHCTDMTRYLYSILSSYRQIKQK